MLSFLGINSFHFKKKGNFTIFSFFKKRSFMMMKKLYQKGGNCLRSFLENVNL